MRTNYEAASRTLIAGFTLLVAAFTIGCGSQALRNGSSDSSPNSSSSLGGSIWGGEIPIVGGTVQLWAVGTGGIGSTARPLVNCTGPVDESGISTPPCAGVQSGPGGSFTLSNLYTCPTVTLPSGPIVDSYVYLTATGGDTGGGNNSAAALMFALGDCQNLASAKPFIVINEVSTIASIFSLQQFMNVSYGTAGAWNIGAPLSNWQGLKNAFATVQLMTYLSTPGVPKLTTVPGMVNGNNISVFVKPEAAKIYTLADIAAYCVDSMDSGGSISSQCSDLFASLKYADNAPADTIQAVYAMAKNPTNVGTAITMPYAATSPTPPWAGGLTSPPNDWTLALNYYSGSSTTVNSVSAQFLASGYNIAADAEGNIWVNNGASSVSEIAPGGVPAAQVLHGYLSNARGLAIDTDGDIWIANSTAGATYGIVEYVVTDGSVKTYPFPSGTASGYSVTLDGSNNAFVAMTTGTKLLKVPAGSPTGTTASIYASIGSTPSSVAVDSAGTIWVANTGTASVTRIVQGTTPTVSSVIKPTMVHPYGVAIDSNNIPWITDANNSGAGNYLTQLLDSGTQLAQNTIQGAGGISNPIYSEVDGGNNIWVANTGITAANSSVSEFNNAAGALTNANGFAHSYYGARDLAIDLSGNIWVANLSASANTTGATSTLTEIVGGGIPTYGPKSLAVRNGKIGQQP